MTKNTNEFTSTQRSIPLRNLNLVKVKKKQHHKELPIYKREPSDMYKAIELNFY